jgi:RNA polymerase-binding protein
MLNGDSASNGGTDTTGGKVLRGPWAGASAGAASSARTSVAAALREVTSVDYWCVDGHITHVRFGQPVVPDTWECRHCPLVADRTPNAGG